MKQIIVFLLLCCTISCFAQDKRPCPRFIIAQERGETFRTNLTEDRDYINEFRKCPNCINIDDSVFIEKKSFLRMLKKLILNEEANIDYMVNGLRVYLAQEQVHQDGKYIWKLRFIFTGLVDDKDTGEYFITTNNGKLKQVDKDDDSLRVLTMNYENNTLQAAYRVSSPNTKNYIFNKGLIYDFISEMTRQARNTSPIVGLHFKLGAFEKDYPILEYRRKILVGFTFVRRDSVEGRSEILVQQLEGIYGCEIDSEPEKRFKAALKDYLTDLNLAPESAFNPDKISKALNAAWKISQAINADTGTPCPPGKNCGTPTLSQP